MFFLCFFSTFSVEKVADKFLQGSFLSSDAMKVNNFLNGMGNIDFHKVTFLELSFVDLVF